MTELQTQLWTPGQPLPYLGSKPQVNRRTGEIKVMTERGMMVNSLLRRDEWQSLDAAVQRAALNRLRAVEDLRSRGLTVSIGSFGTLTTQWSQASEMTAANSSMTGQSEGERDRIEFAVTGQPIPIIYKDFIIPKRQLESARLLNNPLDTTHVEAAARVVAEKLETNLVNGDAAVIFGGDTLRGYTTEANRNTGTATGDWGTISNIIPTVSAMIAANTNDRYYGPYLLYASTNQHIEATTQYYTDGSGQTPADRIRQLDQIADFQHLDTLADGALLLVNLTGDVVDWAEHLGITVVEWMSGDGMVGYFKVMAVATPRVKSDFNGRSGITHYTGA